MLKPPIILFPRDTPEVMPVADWLYRLSVAVCFPYELLSLRFESSCTYLIFSVPDSWSLPDLQHRPELCIMCLCHIPLGEEVMLMRGEYGTHEWGWTHNDRNIRDYVAWSGDTPFCRACYVLQAHIAFFLPIDNDLRLRLLQGNQALSSWLAHLDYAMEWI